MIIIKNSNIYYFHFMNEVPVMTGNICWYRNYRKHKFLQYLTYSIVNGNPLLNEQNLSEKQTKWLLVFLLFKRCYASISKKKKTYFYPYLFNVMVRS